MRKKKVAVSPVPFKTLKTNPPPGGGVPFGPFVLVKIDGNKHGKLGKHDVSLNTVVSQASSDQEPQPLDSLAPASGMQ